MFKIKFFRAKSDFMSDTTVSSRLRLNQHQETKRIQQESKKYRNKAFCNILEEKKLYIILLYNKLIVTTWKQNFSLF